MDDTATLEVLAERLNGLLQQGRIEEALKLVEEVRPADAADLLESLDDDALARLLDHWAPQKSASVLEELDEGRRGSIAQRIPSERLADVLDVMPPDQAVHFLEHIDPEYRVRILGRMERQEASDVAELLDYPEGSAGRRMSQDFVSFGEQATADEVIERLRQIPDDVELIYYIYVLGGSEQLRGIVSLRTLITAPPDKTMGELMETDAISVGPSEDIEAVVDLVRRYNLIAVPVVDEFGRMLGIITVDDILETMTSEAREDLLRFAGSIEEADSGLRRTWPAVRRRLPWLAAAAIIELVIAYFILRPLPTDLLVLTVSYIPLLVFVGGNTAVQAAARVLVRLTSGRTETWSPWGQAKREVEAGLVLAVLAAAATFPLLAVFGRGFQFAAVVAPAVAITVIAGAAIGAGLPIVLQRLKLDPAIASGPLLGSAMDIVSLFIYVTLALNFSRYILS